MSVNIHVDVTTKNKNTKCSIIESGLFRFGTLLRYIIIIIMIIIIDNNTISYPSNRSGLGTHVTDDASFPKGYRFLYGCAPTFSWE
jgi:hypothetical protein